MIGSGIAAHTAFGAFGMRRLWPELQLGTRGLVPWIAPSIIGTIAIVLCTRYYRKRLSREAVRPAALATIDLPH